MKKTIIFCLASAVLAVGLISGAAAVLDSKKEAVLLDEEILYGDPAAAEDLAIDIRYELPDDNYNRTAHVWWDLSYRFHDGIKMTPKFNFLHDPPYRDYTWEYRGLRLETLGSYEGRYNENYWITDEFFESIGKTLPVYNAESPQSGTINVDLSDHFDYIPFWFIFDYPNGVTDLTINERVVGSGYQLYQKLNELFQIPVQKNTYVTIGFSRDQNGELEFAHTQQFGYDDDGNPIDALILSSSVCTDDGIYFTISPTDQNGNRLNLSELKLGYGIYHLPVTPYSPDDPDNDMMQPDPDNLRRVIELDPEPIDEIIHLEVDEARDRLYVLTRTSGRAALLCYDTVTYTLLDTVKLGAAFSSILYEDGYLIICYNDNTFSVLVEKNTKHIELFRHRSHFAEAYLINYPETKIAFDGERLAIASPNYDKSVIDLTLAVYDADGLQFHANYSSSLQQDLASRWYYLDGAPMTIHWGEGSVPIPRSQYSISTSTTIR